MKDYSPNKIPKSTRFFNITWALLLSGICLYSATNETLVYPGIRGSAPVEFSGWPLLFFCIGLIASALNAVNTVIDHYDQRDNERQYKQVSFYLNILSAVAIAVAFAYQFILSQDTAVVISSFS